MKYLLPVVLCLCLARANAQNSTYTNANVYTNIAPAGAGWVQVKLWGAGGGNGMYASGGGGSFAESALPASPGDLLVTVVGQSGTNSGVALGGNGSGDMVGGAPGYLGNYNGRGQGGQGSSAFQLTGGLYLMRAVAGAGGGSGLFDNGAAGGLTAPNYNTASGGQPGVNGVGGSGAGNGTSGTNYSANATTTGLAALNLANGNGGNGGNWSGGGGGGYGGGGGGGGGTGGDGAGGGGGGSYGDLTLPGNGTQPGNTTDASYVSGAGTATNNGMAVITYATGGTVSATNLQLTQATIRGSIYAGGLATGYHFDYGLTTSYGNSTSESNAPAGSGTVVVSQVLSNLTAETTYHYRVVFTNANGTLTGLDDTFATLPTNISYSYSDNGIYTNVAPAGMGWAQVKLWGAGGGDGAYASGGGGAYAQAAIPAFPGTPLVFVVGQSGTNSGDTLGGDGSGDMVGGAPGNLGDYTGRGQGGQGSAAFQWTNGLFVLDAVAGGGGGSGYFSNGAGGGSAAANYNTASGGAPGANGVGGVGGQTGSSGSNYVGNATTIGIAALNLANGNGGNAANWSGGGGGGYGGGGGGGGGTDGDGAGGGGGGSYGDLILPGNGTQPANTTDPLYVSGAGASGNNGMAAVTYAPGGTVSAINLQFTQGTIRGSINAGGLATAYHFDYGFTTSYGNSTSESNAPAGLGTVVVSQVLSNLTVGTTYHYRVVFTNSSGTLTGMDDTFTTLPLLGGSYSSAGLYTNVIPATDVRRVVFKLWGAGGGGNSDSGTGGGGAYSTVTLNASPGETFLIVVGQQGAYNTNNLGGIGSSNTVGGAPGYLGDYNGRSQGGQASAVFQLTNNLLVLKAVAGAGGGAGYFGNGAAGGLAAPNYSSASGGQPGVNGTGGAGGQTGSPGTNYAANATTTGIAALNLANGNGGNASNWSGGGGGGYGGGGGGGGGTGGDGAGGGGGGSYGTTITGSGSTPGNTGDPDYTANAGQGGIGAANGNDGMVVVLWEDGSAPKLQSPARLTNGSFQFSFTNLAGATFTVQTSTNLAATNGWMGIGPATEISPGQFQFTDTQATNHHTLFYRVTSP